MKCPKCQFENPEGMKFCGDCGVRLEKTCPKCNSSNPPGFKFCGECGHNFTIPSESPPNDLSFDEKIDKIQRYLPKGLTEKILGQRDKIEGERKQVTVMFCDMEGFTPLVEQLGPEDAYGIMDQVYEILIHKVHDYEGTVNEMTGDGIMALFGAPIALEDAPQRAIRSALAVHREMAQFNDKLKQERKSIPPLKMRIGVHTGPVVVGTLGNDLRVEFKAVGETVNLASRMEGLSEPGATYVTQDTFKLTEGFFRFEGLGEREVKGKKEPINVYRAIAPSTRRTRFDVSAERGLTPFVGRKRELELLLDGFERAKTGRGQAFSIVSEAGVGKSRLLYEFRKAVSNEDVTFLEGKCLSYSRGVAYHPVIDILKANFDVLEGDGDAEIRAKVKRGLKTLGLDEVLTLPYFLELLSVKDSGIDKIPMSPEAKKDRIMEALKQIVLKGSEIRLLILAYEDLHWADKTSEDILKYILESIPGARVLMLFTYRPEFVHTWGGKSYHNQVTLNRLSNRESLAMVTHLLGARDIDSSLEELILEKTEGVPFFIEEFVASLRELKVIERKDSRYHIAKDMQNVAIPSTIQDVIMARVDTLPEGAKELLQTGSVIEREFSYELIKQVTGLPEQELLSQLSHLKDLELLYERGIYPQSTYIFKHALTQDVVYESILNKRKKKFHEEIGNAIEDLYKENISEYYEVLARHFMKGENYEKGAEYSKLASRKTQRAASYIDAIEYGKKRVLCLERLPRGDANQRAIIDARTTLSGYYTGIAHFVEANEIISPITTVAQEMDYQKALPSIYLAIGCYSLWVEQDVAKAHQFLRKILEFPDKKAIWYFLWMADYNLGWHFSWNCDFERGLEHFRKSLERSAALNDLVGMAWSKGTISGMNYALQGKAGLSYENSLEALRLSEESGDIFAKVTTLTSHGLSCYLKGFFDEAEKFLLEGFSVCKKTAQAGWWTYTPGLLGEMYSDNRKYEKAIEYYIRAKEIFSLTKFNPSWINWWEISEARARVLNEDKNIDLELLQRCYKKNKLSLCDGLNARHIAEIFLNIDEVHLSQAENWIKKAVDLNTHNQARWFLGRDHAVYAELFKRKGDSSAAKESLSKAIKIMTECGADGWIEKYEKELAALS